MKVMVIVKASKESEAGEMPSEQLLVDMGKFNEELVKAGIMLAGEGLHPSSKGVRVQFSGKDRTVIDGPFAETKELIAGYWMWQVKSLEDAIAWVKRCPNPMTSDSEIEIRPVFEPADFGEAMTPEVQAREERLRGEITRYNLEPPRFEQTREMHIAGINETYTFATRDKIPAQWSRFAPQIAKLAGRVGDASYGICWHYKPGVGFDYLTGVEVRGGNEMPKDFIQVHIPAGRHAVFTHRGRVSSIAETLEAIWTKWLPNSGMQVADSPSFERYGKEFDPTGGMGRFEIWLPVKG